MYETDLKLSASDNKMENLKRELHILEREKDLEIKELKSRGDRLDKLLRERN